MDETAGGAGRRHDAAYELGERLAVVGPRLVEGDGAPAFLLTGLDPDSEQMLDVSLAASNGEVRLLNVVNSLDTPVCHVETRRWEQLRADLPDGVRVYT